MDNTYATTWRRAAPLPVGLVGNARRFSRHMVLTALTHTNTFCDEQFLRLLYCHYVFDDLRERFEEMAIALKQMGTFVNTDTCVDMLEEKRDIDGRYFHLSFDDGFRNIFTNAIPILRKHNIPAIVFVPTSLIDADWERTRAYCLETTHYRGVIETLKWTDLRAIVSSGFEVGSHTRTHARFSDISSDPCRLRDEILGSKEDIEQKLDMECKYISWPYGGKSDVDGLSLEMVRRYSYRACFGAFRGSVHPGRTSKYSIPRHHFESEWPVSHLRYFARGNMEKS